MYSVLLDQCHHVLQWRQRHQVPRIGDTAWCYRCVHDRPVQAVLGPWKATCATSTCHNFGATAQREATVLAHAQRHLLAHPLHVVNVWQEGRRADSFYRLTGADLDRQLCVFDR